jgi:hypothetical protein
LWNGFSGFFNFFLFHLARKQVKLQGPPYPSLGNRQIRVWSRLHLLSFLHICCESAGWISEYLFQKRKEEISFDTSSFQTKEKPFFENSRHAPFLLFSLKTNNRHLSRKPITSTLVGAPIFGGKGAPTLQPRKKSYFLGASAGFSGAGAGAGVAAGAGGAGASAGFASSLAAGFGASLALHPIPIVAILITKTIARKRKIHFFM